MVAVMAALEQTQVALFEVEVGDLPPCRGDKGSARKYTFVLELVNPPCDVAHRKCDVVQARTMISEELL